MKKSSFFVLCFFVFCTIIFFFGGVLGIIFTMKHFNSIRALEKSEVVENATITRIIRRTRTPNNTIYFRIINDDKTYRFNMLKLLPGRIQIGDEIEIKFNDDRTLFLVTSFSSTIYTGYIIQVVLFLFCFLLSILFLRDTINIYKRVKTT